MALRIQRRPKVAQPGSLIVVAILVICCAPANQSRAQEVRPLQKGSPIERELRGGESHSYSIKLASSQFAHLVVDQKGVDVSWALFSPEGKQLIELNARESTQGPEPVFLLAEAGPAQGAGQSGAFRSGSQTASAQALVPSGSYRLEVRSSKTAPPGRYEVRVEELRPVTPPDVSRVKAQSLLAEGEQLRAQSTAASFKAAIEHFGEALRHWRAAGDRLGEAVTLFRVGSVFEVQGDKQKALEAFLQSLPLRRAAGDRYGEAATLTAIGLAYGDLGEKQKALEHSGQALAIWRAVGDRLWEAKTLNNIGGAYLELGDNQKAIEYFHQALPLRRALGDRAGEAATLHNIGGLHSDLGEYQKALDSLHQALPLRRAAGDRNGEARTLTYIAHVHEVLGERETALDYSLQALPLRRSVGDRRGEAYTLNAIGATYASLGEKQKALDYYHQALPLSQAVKDRSGEAAALSIMGSLYAGLGENQKALDALSQALVLRRAISDRRGEARSLTGLGAVYAALGDAEKALDHFGRALPLNRAVADASGEAATLLGWARLERNIGRLAEARERIEPALQIVESLRGKVISQQLRSSYFATAQDYYELAIDVLMRLHMQDPARSDAGEQRYDALALELSERARARSLLDLLAEARAQVRQGEVRQGLDAELAERERVLQRQLNGQADALMRLLNGKHTPQQAKAASAEVERLSRELQDLRVEIQRKNPRYAALTQPQPLSLVDIQRTALDAGTMLLEYSLGEERSYLWAVTATSLSSYTLPGRAEIEAAARGLYELWTARRPRPGESAAQHERRVAEAEARSWDEAARLSRVLLGPVARQLENKRLLVVADGALHYVPFAALPDPGTPESGVALPLIAKHEVVNLPSASTLGLLRRELADPERNLRVGWARTIAVLADPVFDKDDFRVRRRQTWERGRPARSAMAQPAPATPSPEHALLLRSARDMRDINAGRDSAGRDLGGGPLFSRLSFSRLEAEAIGSLVRAPERKLAFDFAASRSTALSPELAKYRYVHFAAHGLINSAHPELSGIVLSLVDQHGQPQDGFLRLHEIYNMNLPAELVVLSACRTALGKEVKGEGLVSLTRGFMHAGAAGVLASLWEVDDSATAELMKLFYQGILREQLSPAAALRAAQLAMWKNKRRRSPFYWAAFVLQGDWRGPGHGN